eukprot:1393255-Amorphochlora_amoeboformis.AAC.2
MLHRDRGRPQRAGKGLTIAVEGKTRSHDWARSPIFRSRTPEHPCASSKKDNLARQGCPFHLPPRYSYSSRRKPHSCFTEGGGRPANVDARR